MAWHSTDLSIVNNTAFFNYFFKFLTVLGFHCYVGFSLVAESGSYSPAGACRPLIAVASLVMEHRL